jgi:predicted dehydrogenase
MIQKEKLDIVIIATPTHTHKEIACYCAEQGFNIFLEKPMARTIDECDAIIDSIKDNGIKLFVAHSNRFIPTYGSVKSYLDRKNSTIGEIQSIVSKRLGTFPWSEWFANQSQSGGVILDLSIHDIDYCSWLMGQIDSVSCQASKIIKYNMEVFGESTTKLKSKKDKTAECEASWAKPADFQFYTRTQIKGSAGSIEFDSNKIYNNEKYGIQNIYKTDNAYFNQLDHFFDVIKSKNKEFLVSVSEAKEAVKICLAAIKSAENDGIEINLNAFNE